MSAAYAVFARNGVYIKPHFYTTVTDSNGNVILSSDETGTAVLSEDTCYYMNRMLEGVVTEGTGTKAQISGVSVAGKTGTTTNNCDRWFVGYTHYYSAAVWIGYDNPESINASGNPAVTLWQKVMSQLMEGKTNVELTTTNKSVVTASYCTKSGMLATSICSEDGCAATGYFLEGDAPTSYCEVHTTLTVCTGSPIGDDESSVGYHLAGEYCPEETIEVIPVLDFYRNDAAASVTVSDRNQLKSFIEAQGTCTIHNAEWAANRELMKEQSLVIPQSIITKTLRDGTFALGAFSVDGAGNVGGKLSYVSSNPLVATVDDNGYVTIVGTGTAQITITAEATQYAEEVTGIVVINVTGTGWPGTGGDDTVPLPDPLPGETNNN
jgi:membrane peptidoglycan carboxypeptidase